MPGLRTSAGITALAVVAAVLVRIPFLDRYAYPDEGGLLIVAGHWHEGGPTLYGQLFVDRPPLLLLFWQAALELGGLRAARLLALVAVAVAVAVAGRCGHLLGGRRGTTWAVVVAATFLANPALGTREVDGELLGAPLTLLACLCVLSVAVSGASRWRDDLLALAAGTCGAAALLVKQNLADGLVFGLVLTVTAALSGAWPRRRALRVLALGGVGAALPLGVTALWAATEGPGAGTLWYTLYQFRIDATGVVVAHTTATTQHRLLTLGAVAVQSGLALVLLPGLWALRHRLRHGNPVPVAILAMVGFEVVAVGLGGSYWAHYLIELVPGAVLLAGAAATQVPRRAMLAGLAFSVCSALAAVTTTSVDHGLDARGRARTVSSWLHDASSPGDTGTVTFGHADILAGTGLAPRYPYLWTLPMRTLDPGLDGLVGLLDGKRAPTWLVEPTRLDAWGIDPSGRVQAALDRHYVRAATVCGIPVYLHTGVVRALPPPPTGCTPPAR